MSGHWLPAILSFLIPGLGQLLKKDIFRAIVFFVAAFLTGALTIVIIGWVLYPIVVIWAVIDAYN